MEFTDQKVGVPNNCTHVFCLVCLQEWAKVSIELVLFDNVYLVLLYVYSILIFIFRNGPFPY